MDTSEATLHEPDSKIQRFYPGLSNLERIQGFSHERAIKGSVSTHEKFMVSNVKNQRINVKNYLDKYSRMKYLCKNKYFNG